MMTLEPAGDLETPEATQGWSEVSLGRVWEDQGIFGEGTRRAGICLLAQKCLTLSLLLGLAAI